MAKSGLMVSDDKGNLYFLRPEILDAAKLPKALHKDAKVALKAAKKNSGAPKIKVVGALSLVGVDIPAGRSTASPELSAKATKGAAVQARSVPAVALALRGRRIKTPQTSTIMCPW